jgi:alkanesulfonate monooxygenase SsuD/methylene tetrahydromethanopterin reductase-like flavin-dependent oxidoreductase (luciferase family)
MDFGVFVEQMRDGSNQRTAFREMFELVDASEAWGLDIVWMAEMLMNPARSVLSAPLLVASSVVARTKRLRVGTAVLLLPLNHPLRVAGEIATLDHLSAGRFRFRRRAQRVPALLRRARRSVRREPGALLRGARHHPAGLAG